MDRIELRGLRVLSRCGVLAEEQVRPQPLEVDLDVEADLARAAATDDVVDAVDYGAVCATVERVLASGRFALLEAAAEGVARAVLSDPAVDRVTVAIRKLRPPVPSHLGTAGVRITRGRSPGAGA